MIKIKQRKIAVVVGGANLDIKGYSNNYIRYSSSPGYIEESPGGVGRNIAEDLALLAKDVYLLTVLADDHNGDFLADITAASGVNLDHIKKIAADKIPSGRYLAHLDQSGDLMGAVADMRILAEIDLDYLKSKIELIAGASILILDTNLKLDAVRYLLNFCEDSSIITLI
ncbi:MAG: carbohydrate kinase, partial [Halanaerobium sp. MSAO_Bac5]